MEQVNKMLFQKPKIPNYINEAMEQLELQSQDWLSNYATAYQVLKYDSPDMIVRLGKIGYEYFSTLTIPQIIKIGEQWRIYTSMLWSIDWRCIDIEAMSMYFHNYKEYQSLLIMGSFHPSGYFRERCLKILSTYPNTLSFLMIRLNDWVEEVKSLAFQFTCERLTVSSLEEMLDASYVFMKVKKSKRRRQIHLDQVQEQYICCLKGLIETLDIDYLLSLDIFIRKSFYQIAIEHSLLSLAVTEELLNREKNSFCLLLLIRYVSCHELNIEKLKSYFNHRSFYVRKEAMICYFEQTQDIWDGIENHLLDKSYAIRDYIRFLLVKYTQVDILDFYLHQLDCPIGILGVGECGSDKQINDLLPYLKNSDEKIVKATIQALSYLLKDKGTDIYWQFLLNESITLSKVSYQSIIKYKVHYGAKSVYMHYQKETSDFHKRYLLRILLDEDSWERLPYLLELYWYPDEKISNCIRTRVQQRSPYKKVSKELKCDIINSLNNMQYHLPQEIKDSILFDLKFVCK